VYRCDGIRKSNTTGFLPFPTMTRTAVSISESHKRQVRVLAKTSSVSVKKLQF
jgi:hypothetical protein